MKSLYLFLLVIFSQVSFSQIGGEDEVYLKSDIIDAKFNDGGLEKFHDFVINRIDKTKITKAGKTVLQFTVNAEGLVKNVKIVEISDANLAMEILKIVSNSPKWQPAEKKGFPVDITIKLPFVFKFK